MASQAELDLAKRLLKARVLEESALRQAFALQAHLREQGKQVSLVRILYHQKQIPIGSLDVLGQPPLLTAQPFEDYRLERLCGDGGSGTVYEATYLPNGAPVALKILDPVQALRADFLERFKHEAQLLISFEHDNIVLGYELKHEAGHHYFSMDLVDGITVLEVVERRGHLTREEALSITLQTAQGLEYLHGQGLIHRDIKPANLMVEPDGRVRMIDLGLVRTMSIGEESHEESMTVGTVEYLSPEQARGRSDLDPRADIYSLGLTLYHMVVGEVPFQGESDYEVMAKQIMASLDTQKVKQRRIPPEIHFFIKKMTTKDRDMRFESMAEVCSVIGGYIQDAPVAIDFGPPPVAPPIEPIAPPIAPPVAPPIAPPVVPPKRAPVARPVAPVARPVRPAKGEPPVAKPVAPVAKPVPPVARPVAPKAPVAKPVRPVAKPVAPVAKPVPPVAKPVAPKAPVAKPVAPVAKPVPASDATQQDADAPAEHAAGSGRAAAAPEASPAPKAKPIPEEDPTPKAKPAPEADPAPDAKPSPTAGSDAPPAPPTVAPPAEADAADEAGTGEQDAKPETPSDTPAASSEDEAPRKKPIKAPVPTRRRRLGRRGDDGDAPRKRRR